MTASTVRVKRAPRQVGRAVVPLDQTAALFPEEGGFQVAGA